MIIEGVVAGFAVVLCVCVWRVAQQSKQEEEPDKLRRCAGYVPEVDEVFVPQRDYLVEEFEEEVEINRYYRKTHRVEITKQDVKEMQKIWKRFEETNTPP